MSIKRPTIAGNINALITALAVMAGLMVVVFAAQREFNYRRDELVLQVSSSVAGKPQLQLIFYFNEDEQTEAVLSQFMRLSPAIKHAVLRNSVGEIIASRVRPWADINDLPRFSDARQSVSATDKSFSYSRSRNVDPKHARLALLTGGESVTGLIVPIVSVVNPTEPDLSRRDFGAALTDPDNARSLFVTGYLEIGISGLSLWAQTLPAIASTAIMGLALVALF